MKRYTAQAVKARGALAAGACLVLVACTSDPSGAAGTVYSTTPPGPQWSGSAQMVAVGERVNCLLATDGTPWCWGSPRMTQMRVDDGIRSYDPSRTADWIRDSVCLANTASGDLPGWPCNALHPVRMSTQAFTSVSLAGLDSPLCGLDASNDSFCWDDHRYVELTPDSATAGGLVKWCGTTYCLFSPRKVHAGAPARQIAPYAPCVLTTAGVVRCAGGNYYNQLSPTLNLGLASETLLTVAAPAAFTALAVATDGSFLCGLAANGKPYCWGSNVAGQAGVGNYNARVTAPTAVSTALSFTAIAASSRAACALTTTGLAYCWGNGDAGEIGWNGRGTSSVPVAVSGGHVFTSLIGGTTHFCGLESGGAAWCWGYDEQGQLGADQGGSCPGAAFRCAVAPVRVIGGLTFRQLAAGTSQTCGVTTANAVYCWGASDWGRLGQRGFPAPTIGHPVQITP